MKKDKENTAVGKKQKKQRSRGAKIARGVLLAVGGLVLAAILTVAIGGYILYGDMLAALSSINKPFAGEGRDVYYMEYDGDYGFDEMLDRGGVGSDVEVAEFFVDYISHGMISPADVDIDVSDFGCSTLCVQGEKGAMLGRNFDWSEECIEMLVVTRPDNGYDSVSTVNLAFLGYGGDYLPEELTDKFLALAAPYVPLDGMNEKGLCTAILYVDYVDAPDMSDTEKPDMTITTAMRLVLDKAADVDEAIELLGQYDVFFSIGGNFHLALSDASGRSVCVEWLDGEAIVTETPIITNHYLSEQLKDTVVPDENTADRFSGLEERYDSSNGMMDKDALVQAMDNAGQKGRGGKSKTHWTAVFDTSATTVYYYFNQNFEEEYAISLVK